MEERCATKSDWKDGKLLRALSHYQVDDELEFLIGEGKVLDPNNIFVVVAGLLGGGEVIYRQSVLRSYLMQLTLVFVAVQYSCALQGEQVSACQLHRQRPVRY